MKVWGLLGHRYGDNMQVLALCRALGRPFETKQLSWKPPLAGWTPRYGRRSTLDYLTSHSASELTAPWPDLVISVGWRSVPVARWIQAQCAAKILHIGRPRAPLKSFDLIVTSPQYRLPSRKNVLQLSGPLTSPLTPEQKKSARVYEEKFVPLRRPWIAVLIGGNAPPVRLTRASVCDFASKCNALANSLAGSLLITSGPRTPTWALDLFLSKVSAPHFCQGWAETGDNPYAALLTSADAFVVTNDSVSMTQEALCTSKPLFLYNLPNERSWLALAQKALDPVTGRRSRVFRPAIDWLVAAGLVVLPRFPADYHAGLIRENRATLLGTTAAVAKTADRSHETEKAVQAAYSLFSERR